MWNLSIFKYFSSPSFRYRDPCSESLNEDDDHTITLVGNANRRAVTLAKTCEQGNELRDCRAPRDWSILALQNTRTGKSHYLVICKCPNTYKLGKFTSCFSSLFIEVIKINLFRGSIAAWSTDLCWPPWHQCLRNALCPSIIDNWKMEISTSHPHIIPLKEHNNRGSY